MNRRTLVQLLSCAVVTTALSPMLASRALAAFPEVTVWRDPSCGCCEGWVKHMRGHGFRVRVVAAADLAPIKARHGIPDALQSCHTAAVDGYVLEGHVPAPAVIRLLTERPRAKGLAVPGMPLSSPGMDAGVDHYDVVLFGLSDGTTKVFESH
ncbi:MAG: DUF411 domain-containing protein [Alphaproteobacteria bacterium]|nr:DUF411 domain-containing protein [Alphaproteobacteria bacterium]